MEAAVGRRRDGAVAADRQRAAFRLDRDILGRDARDLELDDITVLIREDVGGWKYASAGRSEIEAERLVEHALELSLQGQQSCDGVEAGRKRKPGHGDSSYRREIRRLTSWAVPPSSELRAKVGATRE